MIHHQGIILQALLPHKRTLTVLDSQLGKLEVQAGKIKGFFELRAGLLITYYPSVNKSYYKIDQIELITMPYDCARIDFKFFHQVLELAYYFLPELSPSSAVFNLLLILLNSADLLQYPVYKKIIMARFFMYVGMHPEKVILTSTDMHNLVHASLEDLVYSADKSFETRLKEWLTECIRMHPQSKRFKTVAVGHNYDT